REGPGVCCSVILSGCTGPREAHKRVGPPAVAHALGRVERSQPAELHEVFSGRFDTAQVHAEDVGNPGSFAPTTAVTALLAVVETAEQMSKHGCNYRNAAATGNQPYRLAGYRHESVRVDNSVVHGMEVRNVMDT